MIDKRRRALISRDAMNSVSRTALARATVAVFDALQPFRKEVQLVALGASFRMLTDVANLNPQDVYTAAGNAMRHDYFSTGYWPQFAAMRFHLEEELLKDA